MEDIVRGLHSDIPCHTHHVLHGGIYTRTIRIPAGCVIVGALVRVPTTLVVSGACKMLVGSEVHEIDGHAVIPAHQHRKQVFTAVTDTILSMSFATNASTVEEAEDQMTDQSPLLLSRQPDAINTYSVTGVQSCQQPLPLPLQHQSQPA